MNLRRLTGRDRPRGTEGFSVSIGRIWTKVGSFESPFSRPRPWVVEVCRLAAQGKGSRHRTSQEFPGRTRGSSVPECDGTCGGISSVLDAQCTAWFPRDANLILLRTAVVLGSSMRPRQRQGAAGFSGGLERRFELRLTETGVTWPDFDRFERFWKFWNVEKALFPTKAESAKSITRYEKLRALT